MNRIISYLKKDFNWWSYSVFVLISVVLFTKGINLLDWQWWAIMVLTVAYYIVTDFGDK